MLYFQEEFPFLLIKCYSVFVLLCHFCYLFYSDKPLLVNVYTIFKLEESLLEAQTSVIQSCFWPLTHSEGPSLGFEVVTLLTFGRRFHQDWNHFIFYSVYYFVY